MYFRLTSENELSLYISDSNERVLFDIHDVIRASKSHYYLSVQLEPGTYFLDIGSGETNFDGPVWLLIDEEQI